MNIYFLIAGVLMIALGVIHSLLGEKRIFRHGAERGLIQDDGKPVIKGRYLRILRVSWHLVSFFGFGFAAIILWMASEQANKLPYLEAVITFTVLSAGLLVLIGTRAKHPGWIVLFVTALLIWIG